ncbi:hypothetical protein [Aggregatilinea lenta]|uniref:hypothetical protein n=1 Tax=Aggregatilinea lenta TaxID=913108 RepID=UPI0013C2A7EE|nr:hypothetical protein [Aggregatilinea lenta]
MFPSNYTAGNDTTTVVLDTLWTTPTGGGFPPIPEASIAAKGSNPHYDSPIDFTVTFSSGPVYGFDVNDVTIGGAAPGTKTATVTGSSPVYNIRVNGMAGAGTVTIQVRAGAITDNWSQSNTQTVTSSEVQDAVSSPPAFTSANTTTFQLLQPNSFSLTASGPELHDLVRRADLKQWQYRGGVCAVCRCDSGDGCVHPGRHDVL